MPRTPWRRSACQCRSCCNERGTRSLQDDLRAPVLGAGGMTADEFGALGMSPDEINRAHAAIRKLAKECVDVTRERLRRGEQRNLNNVARNALVGIRGALVGFGLSAKQREEFLILTAAEILRDHLQTLERTSVKR